MSYKTEQRAKLYELLKGNPHKYFTAKEIAKILEPQDVSLSAIYRNLASLTEEGVVKKSIKESGRESVYRYANDDTCREELHLTCSECGRVFHMNHAITEIMENDLEKNSGFRIDKIKTVIYGICEECSKKEK